MPFRRQGKKIRLWACGKIRKVAVSPAQCLHQIGLGSGGSIQALAGHGKAAQQTGPVIIASPGNRKPASGAKLPVPPEGRFFIPFRHDTVPYLQTVKGQGKIPFPGNQRAEGVIDDAESPVFSRFPE